MERPTLQQIKTDSPMPWVSRVIPGFPAAQVSVMDATGKEVPIFHIVAFAEIVSAHMAQQPKEAV